MRGVAKLTILGALALVPPIPRFEYMTPSLERKAEIEASINHLDPIWFKALCKTESAWNADATSPVGAQGITQLMPATVKKLGIKQPYHPHISIEGGARWSLEGALELGFNPEVRPLTLKEYEMLAKWYNCGMTNLKKNPKCGDDYWLQVKKNMEFYKNKVAVVRHDKKEAGGGGNNTKNAT